MRSLPAVVLTLTVLCAVHADAQSAQDHPGYFPIENLGILSAEDLSLEVNLLGPMLRLVAAAETEEDPEFAALVSRLEAVRVQQASLDGLDRERLRSGIRQATDALAASGWQSMLKMRDGEEEIQIFLREIEDRIVGLTILALEGEEITLVNLVGEVSLENLDGLARNFGIQGLESSDEETTP